MTYRVIQWATGGVGRAAIEGVLDHPELELVGCWVHSADKDGRDVGELIGRESLGVTATTSEQAIPFRARKGRSRSRPPFARRFPTCASRSMCWSRTARRR